MKRLLLAALLVLPVAVAAQGVPEWAAPSAERAAPSGPSASDPLAGPTLPPPPNPVPLDGGLSLLALAGAGFLAHRIRRRRGTRAMLVLVGLAGAGPAAAQVVLTDAPYTQDFNTLATTAMSSTVPAGWAFAESGTNANTTYTAGTGSGTAGDTYSFGATASSERAFGGLQSGSLIPTIGAQLQNGTGATIASLMVAYTGEQWRIGNNSTARDDRLDFQYSLDATSLTTGTWTDVNALDFTNPIKTAASAGPLDGNAAANRTAVSATISGLGIPAGATFWIRWTDLNATGSDDGLAVDDFSITVATHTAAQTADGVRGWRMLAPPVQGMDVGDLVQLSLVQGLPDEYPSGTTNLFTGYTGNPGDNTPPTVVGFVPPAGEASALPPGRGFIWYLFESGDGGPAPEDPSGESLNNGLPLALTATGAAVAGTHAVTIAAGERSGVSDDGFYLLGNPFPVPFDLSGLSLTAGTGTLQASFEVWDPNASAGAGSYVLLNTAADETDDLAVWQGFFAQVTTGGEKTFSFDPAFRQPLLAPPFYGLAEGPVAARNAGGTAARWLGLTLTGATADGATYDEAAAVALVEDGTAGWDRHDLSKLRSLAYPAGLIAPVGVGPGGAVEEKAVESLPYLPAAAVSVPLALTTTSPGTYTLAWSGLGAFPADWALVLLDTETGATADLRQAPSFAFSADAVTGHARFVLTITPGITTGTADPLAGGFALSAAYPNPSAAGARATLRVAAAQRVRAALYDALGREVAEVFDGRVAPGADHVLAFDGRALATGAYVLRVTGETFAASRRLTLVR